MSSNRHHNKYRLAAVLSAIVIAVSGASLPVYADDDDELTTQEKLDRAKAAASDTKDAISENQEGIDALNVTKSGLNSQIADLNTQLTSIVSQMNALGEQIDDKQAEIDATQETLDTIQAELDEAEAALEEAQETQAAQYAAMKSRVQFLYEKGSGYLIEVLLRANTFGEFLNRQNYIKALSAYDSRLLEEYKETSARVQEEKEQIEARKAEIETQQAALESEQSDLQSLQNGQAAKRNEVSGLVASAAGSLSLTDAQLADAQAITDALEEQLKTQNAEISELQKQLEEEQRLQQISDSGVWRDLSDVTFEEGDRTLLANLIYCEAGNQPYSGQVAVGAVVINRMLSPAFPDTLSGVIYQSWQFEPASTGRLALALSIDQATDACYQAADAAMSGQSTVGDCLFFRTPIDEVMPKYTIGGHIFY